MEDEDRENSLSSVVGIFSGKNTGSVCHFVPQGIFPTQGLNPCHLCLLHCQKDSLPLCPLGKPLFEFVQPPEEQHPSPARYFPPEDTDSQVSKAHCTVVSGQLLQGGRGKEGTVNSKSVCSLPHFISCAVSSFIRSSVWGTPGR